MIKPATPYTGDAVSLPLHQITTKAQIRTRNGFDETSLRELSESIKTFGLIEPIIVHRTGAESYELIAGERRLLAVELAGLAEIAALVRAIGDDVDIKALQAVENIQREQLCLMDRAEGVAELVTKVGAKRAASLLSKSPAWISKHVNVLKLAEPVKLAAAEGGCEDFEVLHCVHQLGKRAPAATRMYHEALELLADGSLSRQQARSMLDQVNQADATADTDESSENDNADDSDASTEENSEKLGKLELAESVAREIFAALEYTKKNKPSSRPHNATLEHVRGFIEKHWGA